MTAAEDQRPGPIEDVDETNRRVPGHCGERGQSDEQRDEGDEGGDAKSPGATRGNAGLGGGFPILRPSVGSFQPDQTEHSAEDDRGDLDERRRHDRVRDDEHEDDGETGDARAPGIRGQRFRHRLHGTGDDGHRGGLESEQPSGIAELAEGREPEREEGEQNRRRQSEGHPRGGEPRQTCSAQPESHADLTRRGAGQHLAQGHEVGVFAVVEPGAAADEGLAEVPEVGDGAAERRQAQAKERSGHLGGAGRCSGHRISEHESGDAEVNGPQGWWRR